jgi:tetratricopeptide (TPR) repeat protein
MCKRLLILIVASYWALGAGGAEVEEDERRFRRAISAAVTAGDDAAAGKAWNNLATVYFGAGQLKKAERALQKSLARWEAARGTPAQMAYPRMNLAVLRIEQRRYSESMRLIRAAKEGLAAYGERYALEVATGETALGRALVAVKRYEEAREALDSAVEILEAHPAAGSRLGTALFVRGTLDRKEGRREEAEREVRAAIGVWRDTLGARDATYASGVAYLAVMIAKRNPEEAGELFAEALEIMDSALAAGHPFLGQLYQAYGEYLKKQGQKREAKHFLQEGEEILRTYSRSQGIGMTIDLQALRAEN